MSASAGQLSTFCEMTFKRRRHFAGPQSSFNDRCSNSKSHHALRRLGEKTERYQRAP
jgi:hypothetical protein